MDLVRTGTPRGCPGSRGTDADRGLAVIAGLSATCFQAADGNVNQTVISLPAPQLGEVMS